MSSHTFPYLSAAIFSCIIQCCVNAVVDKIFYHFFPIAAFDKTFYVLPTTYFPSYPIHC